MAPSSATAVVCSYCGAPQAVGKVLQCKRCSQLLLFSLDQWNAIARSVDNDELVSDDGDGVVAPPCVVVYLDELGTKGRLAEPSLKLSDASLAALESRVELLHSPALAASLGALKVFTDNLALVYRWPPRGGQDLLREILAALCVFLQKSVLMGRVYRGGVALGPAYASGDVLLGSALITAVDLEERVANVPRVVLSDAVGYMLSDHSFGELSPSREMVLADGDGRLFVDYLWTPNAEAAERLLPAHGRAVEALYADARPGAQLDKVGWLIDYHNYRCAESAIDVPLEPLGAAQGDGLPRAPRTFRSV